MIFLSDGFLPSSPVTMLSRVDNFWKNVFGGISADNFRLENFGSIDDAERELQKTNRFNKQKNNFACASHFFFLNLSKARRNSIPKECAYIRQYK